MELQRLTEELLQTDYFFEPVLHSAERPGAPEGRKLPAELSQWSTADAARRARCGRSWA